MKQNELWLLTLLMVAGTAAVQGDFRLVEQLLKAGANPNMPIATGETPIMTCASTGSADAVRTLIELLG